jgi:hypothetical protein
MRASARNAARLAPQDKRGKDMRAAIAIVFAFLLLYGCLAPQQANVTQRNITGNLTQEQAQQAISILEKELENLTINESELENLLQNVS